MKDPEKHINILEKYLGKCLFEFLVLRNLKKEKRFL